REFDHPGVHYPVYIWSACRSDVVGRGESPIRKGFESPCRIAPDRSRTRIGETETNIGSKSNAEQRRYPAAVDRGNAGSGAPGDGGATQHQLLLFLSSGHKCGLLPSSNEKLAHSWASDVRRPAADL